MSREERAARAVEQAKRPSPRDVIMACVATLCPARFTLYQETGRWGDPDDRDTAAPYVIKELDNGTQQVQVFGEGGDVVGGQGATLDEAVTVLAKKVLR